VKAGVSAVAIAPSNKSPLVRVVAFPLFGEVLDPDVTAVASSEFALRIPEYSRMAKRSVWPEIVSLRVTVFAPPAMFSA